MLYFYLFFSFFFVSTFGETPKNICTLPQCECLENSIKCVKYNGSFLFEKIPDQYTSLLFEHSWLSEYNGLESTDGNNIKNLTFSFTRARQLNLLKFRLEELNFGYTEIALKKCNIDGSNLKVLQFSPGGIVYEEKHHLIKLLKSAKNLEFLAVTSGYLYNISDDMISSLKNLKVLLLDDCLLDKLDPLSSLTKLETIDLSRNLLKTIPENFLENSAHSLKNFELTDNPFTELNIDFCKYKSLQLLELDKIDLKCDCKWLNGLNISVVQPSDLK